MFKIILYSVNYKILNSIDSIIDKLINGILYCKVSMEINYFKIIYNKSKSKLL